MRLECKKYLFDIKQAATQISEHRRIIAFRNILIHGYEQIDDRLVWGLLDSKLPIFLQDVRKLLEEETQQAPSDIFMQSVGRITSNLASSEKFVGSFRYR